MLFWLLRLLVLRAELDALLAERDATALSLEQEKLARA